MENPVVLRQTFQRELKALLKDLVKVFPNDKEIKMLSSTINIAMLDDPDDRIIQRFFSTTKAHEEKIEQRNPAFFDDCRDDGDSSLLSQLNAYWSHLSPDNQSTVWDYIQVLFCLSKAFFVQKA